MIHSEEEYGAGIRELGALIERENALEAADLQRLSDLADALIAWEETHDSLDGRNLSPKLEIRQGVESSPERESLIPA